jgi:hypothetical protein
LGAHHQPHEDQEGLRTGTVFMFFMTFLVKNQREFLAP